MQSLGEIISRYRKNKNLSQKELSNLLGKQGLRTSNTSISNWEKNTAEPTSSMLMALCTLQQNIGITRHLQTLTHANMLV